MVPNDRVKSAERVKNYFPLYAVSDLKILERPGCGGHEFPKSGFGDSAD